MIRFFKYQILIHKRTLKTSLRKSLFSFLGAFFGISFVFLLHSFINKVTSLDGVMLIGSFGASAVILFGTPNSPYAMPRNVIGGHIISALIGLFCFKLYGIVTCLWFCCALAVSTSIAVMQFTHTTHPPGGATALIAVIGSDKIHSLKFMYIISPVLTGALVLLGTSSLLHYIKNR